MGRYNSVLATGIGGAIIGAWVFGWIGISNWIGDNGVIGALLGGALGIWIGWPE